jgi:hypothetical protein
VEPLKALLKKEVTTAAAKMAKLTTMMADASKTELVALDDASVDPAQRFKRTYMSLFRLTAEQFRALAIVSAGWATLAESLAISDADLHMLVSRRLMMTERMLWYVGGPAWRSRSWDFSARRRKQWQDGWDRMFEYPRLRVDEPFTALCKAPRGTTVCDPQGTMSGWTKRFGGQFDHDLQLNPTARRHWKPAEDFFFDKGGGAADPAPDPVQAILDLFKPSKRFDERNLLPCDHVIDCLHLEALARVKTRRENGKRKWFKDLTDVESDGWLRIISPGEFAGGVAFLVSHREPRHFQSAQIEASELIVGDHVVVINHPAYDAAREHVDVWRLENAIVVATFPRLLLQGHGTLPLPFTSTRRIPVKDKATLELEPSMRLNMLGLFNKKLGRLREAAKKENTKASPRTEITFDSKGALVQRTDVGPYSGYDPGAFTAAMAKLARWWIRWNHDPEHNEHAISIDSVWAQQTWDKSLVELTSSFGYFPLWLPRPDRHGNPMRKGGKISALKEVFVSQKMAPGWNWYYDKDESPDEAAVHKFWARRPKVS